MKNIVSAFCLAALMSSAALATTATSSLTPSATITNICTVTGNPIAFGTYNTLTGAAVTQTATIGVTCTNGMTAPPVTLGQGANPGTSSTDTAPLRQLNASVGHNLTYNLYSDSGNTVVWGNVTGVASPTPSGSAQNMTVYGKIDSAQTTAIAGTYSDTVVVTVTF